MLIVFMEKKNAYAENVVVQVYANTIKLNIYVKTVVDHKFANIINIKITAKNAAVPPVVNPPGVRPSLRIQPMKGTVLFAISIFFQRNRLSVIIKQKKGRSPNS